VGRSVDDAGTDANDADADVAVDDVATANLYKYES